MAKLIDIDDIFGEKVIMVSQNAYDEVMKLMRMIREAPEVDAVPVVRCKDCKWNYDTSVNHGNMFPKCKFTDYVRTGDFYCAMGERREDER